MRALPIPLFRQLCCRMCRLATKHSVTDRQREPCQSLPPDSQLDAVSGSSHKVDSIALTQTCHQFTVDLYRHAPHQPVVHRQSNINQQLLESCHVRVDLMPSIQSYHSFSSSWNLSVLGLRTKFGQRAFSHAGPAAWNALPEDIRAPTKIVKFLGNSSKLIFLL